MVRDRQISHSAVIEDGYRQKLRGHYTSRDLVHKEANGSPSGCWLMVGSVSRWSREVENSFFTEMT